MNGGKEDDIMAALANSLESKRKLDATAIWKTVDKSPRVRLPLNGSPANGTARVHALKSATMPAITCRRAVRVPMQRTHFDELPL